MRNIDLIEKLVEQGIPSCKVTIDLDGTRIHFEGIGTMYLTPEDVYIQVDPDKDYIPGMVSHEPHEADPERQLVSVDDVMGVFETYATEGYID